jgi:dUTP pyrophosphatase
MMVRVDPYGAEECLVTQNDIAGVPAQGGPVVRVAVQRLDPESPIPSYAHVGDAGADLHSAVDMELLPGARTLVPTGIAIALPPGHVGLVHPRSGLASRLGVTVLNAPGTVDSGYRGEIMVNLVNHDPVTTAKIARGDRIAQLVVQRVERADFHLVDELSSTHRGAGGHGSTGGHAVLGPSAEEESR